MKANSLLEGGVKRLGALFLLVWAVPLIPAGVGLMLWGLFQKIEHNSWEDPLPLGVALVIMGGLLWLLSKRLDEAASLVRRRRRQNRMLKLAQARGGRLTVTEAAADTGLTVEESEAILKGLADGGYVEIEVTDAGLMVYRFPEVLYEHEKFGHSERIWSAG